MAERTGSVEFRSGRWWARPTLADGSRGNRVPLPPGATEEQAREKARALTELAARKGITRAPAAPHAPEPSKDRTVAKWFEAWLEDRERRGLASVRTDRGRWSKWIEPRIGGLEMAAVTTEDLERLVQYLDQAVIDDKLHWKTACNAWGLVSKAFDDAAHCKTLALRIRKDNPATGVRPPDQGPERGKQFLYPSEFLALMACERVPVRWRELIALQIYYYGRAGELEAQLVDDVDLEHQSIHIHRAVDRDHDDVKEVKTNNPRRIPVEPNLFPLLEQLVGRARATRRTLLVEMPPLCDLPPRLRKYLQWAGVARAELYKTTATSKQITWHDLRATAATWLAIRGEAPQRIMALCGHENMETTMGYVRLAAVLHADSDSVFPPIVLPQSLPQDPKTWGQIGGRLSQSLQDPKRPQRDSNPRKAPAYAEFQTYSAGNAASEQNKRGYVSPRNVVLGAALGQREECARYWCLPCPDLADDEAAAALAVVGRQVLAGSALWDQLEADVLWLADPAAAVGGAR